LRNTGCIHGFEVEAFTFKALKRAWKEARMLSEREHVSPYIYKHAEKIERISIPEDIPGIRLVLDHKEDYAVIKEVFENLYGINEKFGYEEVLEFVRSNVEIFKKNSHIERDEGLRISLERDRCLSEEEIERLI